MRPKLPMVRPLSPQAKLVLRAMADAENFPLGISRAEALRVFNINNLTARITELRSHGIPVVKQTARGTHGILRKEVKVVYWRLGTAYE